MPDTDPTTWGDCSSRECEQYGTIQYGIEPGDECDECGEPLRWFDRWHNGKHDEDDIKECEVNR